MKFQLGEVLGRMWKIGWSNKRLWGIQILSLISSFFLFLGAPLPFTKHLPDFLQKIMAKSTDIFSRPILSLTLMLPFIFTSFIAQTLTTHDILRVEKRKRKLSIRELYSRSQPYFLRIFGLYFIFGTAWMLIGAGFTALNSPRIGIGPFCFSFLLLFSIATSGLSVLELTQAAIIAGNTGLFAALSHGWKLFQTNALNIILLIVILYFGFSFFLTIATLPIMISFMVFISSNGTKESLNKPISEFFFATVPFIIVFLSTVQGVMIVFFQSAWAVTYLRLNKNANTPIAIEINP